MIETDPTGIMEGDDQDQKLQLVLENLEREWDFMNKRPQKTLYRNTTSSGSCKTTRTPMPSPPFEETAWKVRTNDLAVDEILRERRAAFESGHFKGRRLFEDETEPGFGGINVSCSGLVEESEVRTVFSYEPDDNDDENWPRKEHLSPPYPHCSCSSPSSPMRAAEPETLQTEMVTMAERKTVVRRGRARLNVSKVCIGISLIVFIVAIISTGSFGVYDNGEVILTPT